MTQRFLLTTEDCLSSRAAVSPPPPSFHCRVSAEREHISRCLESSMARSSEQAMALAALLHRLASEGAEGGAPTTQYSAGAARCLCCDSSAPPIGADQSSEAMKEERVLDTACITPIDRRLFSTALSTCPCAVQASSGGPRTAPPWTCPASRSRARRRFATRLPTRRGSFSMAAPPLRRRSSLCRKVAATAGPALRARAQLPRRQPARTSRCAFSRPPTFTLFPQGPLFLPL